MAIKMPSQEDMQKAQVNLEAQAKIDRYRQMLDAGLIDEICMLEKKYSRLPNCMKAIGIKETLAYLDGIYDKKLLEEKIITNTARLAKRQTTFNNSQFDDVINTLNAIEKYDWPEFINSRLKGHVNLSKSLEDQGWKLTYNDQPSAAIEALESRYSSTDVVYSLGFSVNKDGKMRDVLWDSPAFNAGLAPSMKIIAVNNTQFSGEVLKDAVTKAKESTAAIKLLVKNFDQYSEIQIDYHEGLKYPHLERIKGKPDYLSQLLAKR